MPRFSGQSIDLEPSEFVLQELEARLRSSPKKTREWGLRVLKRQLKRGKTAASKNLRAILPPIIKKRTIDERIATRVISESAIVGNLRIRSQRLPLVQYMTQGQIEAQWRRQQKAKQGRRGTRRKAVPLKIRVYRGEARREYPDHFVNRSAKTGRWHVMERRDPLDKYSHSIRYGPPILERFNDKLTQFADRQALQFNAELVRVLRVKVPL